MPVKGQQRVVMAHVQFSDYVIERFFRWVWGESLRGDVVKGRHPETGHHGPAALFGQQFVPHHCLRLEGMLSLQWERKAVDWTNLTFVEKVCQDNLGCEWPPNNGFDVYTVVCVCLQSTKACVLYSPPQCGKGQQTPLEPSLPPSQDPQHPQPFRITPYTRTSASA